MDLETSWEELGLGRWDERIHVFEMAEWALEKRRIVRAEDPQRFANECIGITPQSETGYDVFWVLPSGSNELLGPPRLGKVEP